MLLSLHIENIAVIKSVDFDFSMGFTVLTGETGAGKSIVIDSINLLLGGKTERELIRAATNWVVARVVLSRGTIFLSAAICSSSIIESPCVRMTATGLCDIKLSI